MPFISSLLLDYNKLHSRSQFPKLKQLRVLTLNNNLIGLLLSLTLTLALFRQLSFDLFVSQTTTRYIRISESASANNSKFISSTDIYIVARQFGLSLDDESIPDVSSARSIFLCFCVAQTLTYIYKFSFPFFFLKVVISQLPKLKHLDSQSISSSDRQRASSLSSSTVATSSPSRQNSTSSVSSPSSLSSSSGSSISLSSSSNNVGAAADTTYQSPAIAVVVADLSEQP